MFVLVIILFSGDFVGQAKSYEGLIPVCLRRLRAIVAHLRAQLPATALLLAAVLPRGFEGDHTGQWQTRRPNTDDGDWPNPFMEVHSEWPQWPCKLDRSSVLSPVLLSPH